MPRLARRSAGDRVARRAGSLSDSLLDAEEDAFRLILGVLTARAPHARRVVADAWGRARNDPARVRGDARMLRELSQAHADALAATTGHVRALAETSARRSLASIREELTWCEQTLARRHEGTAGRAAEFAQGTVEATVGSMVGGYEDGHAGVLREFQSEARRQVLLSASRAEPLERMTARLFSPVALSLPGNGGRGVWFRSGPWLAAGARNVSIGVMNGVRVAAIDGFNSAWREGFARE